MRSRSHRLPTSDPHDDWVDGSWTVDCVCGVNFDDGEEMVNCDECGVWVHTRCSRYVKGDKSFACDKCKNKNSRNDSEETEVAQLLVELPTKTLRMDNPYPYPHPGPPRRPFRLWTDIPIEERVHVQGTPGGDRALFGGLSSVFTPELWKSTGYVPKKFNFQYREFPCWDDREEIDAKMEDENENPADKGAGVLFSLSKDNFFTTPVASMTGMQRQVEDEGHDRVAPSTNDNKSEGDDLDARPSRNDAKMDRSLIGPSIIQSGRRKKEDSKTSKDKSAKRKARVVEKEGDFRKKAHASKTASILSSDAKQSEIWEDKGSKVRKTDNKSNKNENGTNSVREDHLAEGYHVGEDNVDMFQRNLASGMRTAENFSSGMSRLNLSIGGRKKENEVVHHVSSMIETSPITDDGVLSFDDKDSRSAPMTEEVVGPAANKSEDGGLSSPTVGIGSHKWEPLIEDPVTAKPKAGDKGNFPSLSGDMKPHSVLSSIHIKTEMNVENGEGVFDVESFPRTDVRVNETKSSIQYPRISADQLSGNCKVNSEVITSSQSGEQKVQAAGRGSEAVSGSLSDKADGLRGPSKHKLQMEDLGNSLAVQKTSSEFKQCSKSVEEPVKPGSSMFSSPAPPSQRKVVVSLGKSSASSATVISKPFNSDNCRPANVLKYHSAAKQLGISDSNFSSKKDKPTLVRVEERRQHDMPRKVPKEQSKSSAYPALRLSHSANTSHAPISKRTSSDSKDFVLHTSSVVSAGQNVAFTLTSSESTDTSQIQNAPLAQNKTTTLPLPQKSEKVHQSSGQPSSKVISTPSMQPPATLNSNAALSDEELALLLHQELNSSPRVPRVPRMRHAGSLPQLASPSATSMLMKRTSSSGGKDHSSVFKRKNRDFARDRSTNVCNTDDEEKKVDRVPSLSDQRRHDTLCTTDPIPKSKVEDGFTKGVLPDKKSTPPASSGPASSALSSSSELNEQNLASACDSPRNGSDDDSATIRRPTHLTLPGLIDEIMRKGKRMTYEELCNAVLPQWPNLRKHNGERYAYSSHSQAVLDCLRNRHEWARLVDRGPKTNASRKRRKPEVEALSFESEDSEYTKDRTGKEVQSKSLESQREEFPKGKRKARKRRRLALQGREIKDVRRRRRDAVLSDDDIGSGSSSSEEGMFSEDEIQGSGTCPVGSEASASSDGAGAMQ